MARQPPDGRSAQPEFDFSVVRALRHRAGVTLEQIVEATGIGSSTLNRIEKNQNVPSLPTLIQLATFFGMSPAHLLDLAQASVVRLQDEMLPDLGAGQRRGVPFPGIEIIQGRVEGSGLEQRLHRHEGHYQYFWLLAGLAETRIGDKTVTVRAGQALRFDGDFEHGSELAPGSEYVVVLVPKVARRGRPVGARRLDSARRRGYLGDVAHPRQPP